MKEERSSEPKDIEGVDEQIEIRSILGKGTFGTVYLVYFY